MYFPENRETIMRLNRRGRWEAQTNSAKIRSQFIQGGWDFEYEDEEGFAHYSAPRCAVKITTAYPRKMTPEQYEVAIANLALAREARKQKREKKKLASAKKI